MNLWEGKSRGTVWGYKIFYFLITKTNLKLAYFVLYFVAAYFWFFSPGASRASYYYFHERRKLPAIKSWFKVYQSYYKFGQTIIDKLVIFSGAKDKFEFELDGFHRFKEALKEKKGTLLISAHVGNFEISEFFLDEIDNNGQIHLVTTDQEHRGIKNFLDQMGQVSGINPILIKDNFSHLYEIKEAVLKNEIVCLTGDRFIEGSKTMRADLFGKTAYFPAGPFVLAERLKTSVIFVYVMKETNKKYHLYARVPSGKNDLAQNLLNEYTANLTNILERYPLQWFNYYDFWNAINKKKLTKIS